MKKSKKFGKLPKAKVNSQKPALAPLEDTLNLAYQRYQTGNLQEARSICEQLLQVYPDHPEALHCLGGVLYQLRENETAIQVMTKVTMLDPTWVEAHYNLGNALVAQGRLEEAVESYRQALAFQPNMIEVHYNLANALAALEQLEAAVDSYRQVLALSPNMAEAHYNFGTTLLIQGKSEEALYHFQQASSLIPNWAEAHDSKGQALAAVGRGEEAVFCFEQALQLQPELMDTHLELCLLLLNQSNFTAARLATDRYWQLGCRQDRLRSAFIRLRVYLQSGAHLEAYEQFRQIEPEIYLNSAHFKRNEANLLYEVLPFFLPYLRDQVEANTNLCKLIGQLYVESCLSTAHPTLSNRSRTLDRTTKDQPLRIGFISKHLRRHSVGWCSLDIIKELSRLTPHLYLYYTDSLATDDLTEQFKQIAPLYIWSEKHPHRPVSAPTLIEQLVSDQLDVIIDMDSLMHSLHAHILYERPAPICLSWLGCDAPFISPHNYYLCDRHTHSDGVEAAYREQLLRMPDASVAVSGFICQPSDREAMRQALQIEPHQVVYLCVATGHKLNCDLVAAQVKIIKQVPDSVLLHKGYGDPQMIQDMYRQECAAQGVDDQRFRFLSRSPLEEEHRTIYQMSDVLLDTYPYNGGTHNLESLWFNVPLVTRAGEQGPARLGYSFLQTLKISEGVAWNWEEYITWGVRLGLDGDLRQNLRNRLLQSKQSEHLSPLWNPQKFAQDLYVLLNKIRA